TFLPGDAGTWTAAVIAGMLFPVYPLLWEAIAGPKPHQPWRVFLRALQSDLETAIARRGAGLTGWAAVRYFAREMLASPLIAGGALLLILVLRTDALYSALPI